MRPNPQITYAQQRCALTANLRHLAREAEAEAAAARAETALIRAQTDAELAILRAEIKAERAALTEFTESPQWQRDLLCLARERVRAELTALSKTHKSCQDCGSFGRGFYDNILNADIDALNKTHGLAADQNPDPISWAVPKGYGTRRGKALHRDWQTPAPEPRRTRRADIW
jgi:hypothetical protein